MAEYGKLPKIVAATKGGKTEYWAVTYIGEDAVDVVREFLEQDGTSLNRLRIPKSEGF
jgi:hypothetical protein